jgi:signal transduction histidine kinase
MALGSIRLRWLLLGSSGVVLAAPLAALAFLRVYDTYLVRQTERQLIAQSVVIAESFREAWLSELAPGALAAAGVTAPGVPPFRPPARQDDAFIPIEPVSSFNVVGDDVSESQNLPMSPLQDTPERRAGTKIEPLLRRSQVFNLSGARVLDRNGCVVATSRGEAGSCLNALPEVKKALSGEYAALVRQRITDEPLPPISDVRSRGSVRVFTALPVFSDGQVVAVVRMSRTSVDALTSLWHARRGLVLTAGLTVLMVLLSSVLFSFSVVRPLVAMSRHAEAVASGSESQRSTVSLGVVPYEIRRLSESLQTMTAKLKGHADYVTELAANVSHELKSPITAIRGAAELLRDQWQHMDETQRRKFVENIDADAERMQRLVTRLLELAQIEHVKPKVDNVNVERFMRRIVERSRARLHLRFDHAPEFIDIVTEHFDAAVQNLVDNAMRFGGDQPIWIEVGQRGGRLMVKVSDQGPGISTANQTRLFQRFFTTERERGGTGLGLSIVKAVAEGRGGSIACESAPGRTVFTLVL